MFIFHSMFIIICVYCYEYVFSLFHVVIPIFFCYRPNSSWETQDVWERLLSERVL